MRRPLIYPSIASFTPIIASVIGVMLWMSAACDFQDDYFFRNVVEHRYDEFESNISTFVNYEGGKIDNINDVGISILNHYSIFNARLADKLLIISNLLPAAIVDLLHAIMVGLMIVLVLRLTHTSSISHPLLSATMTVAIWIVLPWDNLSSSNAFFFNYVWSATFNLLFLHLLLTRHNPNRRQKVWLSLLAIISAMMHEGFALPISVALLAWIIVGFQRGSSLRSPSTGTIPILICYWLGTVAFMLCPGLWWRLEHNWDSFNLGLYVENYTVGALPMWILLLLACIYTHCYGRQRLQESLIRNILPVTIIITSMLLSIKSATFDRAWWLAYIFTIILIFRFILQSRLGEWLLGRGRRESILTISLSLCIIAWFSEIAWWQTKMTQEVNEVKQIMEGNQSNLYYANITQRSDLPRRLLDIPTGKYECWGIYSRAEYMNMPKEYQSVPFDSLPKVNGENNLRGVFPNFYSPTRLNSKRRYTLTYGNPATDGTIGNTNISYSWRRIANILSGGDGRLKVWNGLHEMPVIVSEEMKKQGICQNDTAWFYQAAWIPKSVEGCPLLRIDTIK